MSFFWAFSLLALSLPSVNAAPSVTIAAGTIHGMTCTNGASAFLSIPYAVPPVGDLRWTAPQAYDQKFPSTGYSATTKGAACIQFGSQFLETGTTSEDCLFIDVWVPPNAKKGSNLPVKVFIYGGGEQAGGIQDALYDGCNLAAHDTLLVSINYRLGPIGYMTLESAGIAGNFGIQDLVLGLEWVQTNIAAFGGNPKKVVVFGESSGAQNVYTISTLPNATSLISSGVWESGSGPELASATAANSLGASFAKSVNCSTTDIACLRAVSTTILQAAAPEAPGTVIFSSLNNYAFQPHVDGITIPAQPWSVGPKVPMIFGSNADEGALFVLGTYQSPNISAANYSSFLTANFGAAASIVEQQYPLNLSAFVSTGVPAYAAMSTIITESLFRCPTYQALLKAEANNMAVFSYLNSHTPSCQWMLSLPAAAIPLVGATHTSELPYVFGNGDGLPLGDGNCSFSSDENAISTSLIAAWSAMASTGNPSVQGGLQWPAWKNSTSQGVNIVNDTSVGTIDYSQCAFWDMIDNLYLNFTSLNANATSGNASTVTSTPSGAQRVELGFLELALVAGATIAALMG